MIRYLKQEEKRDTLPLWREAFREDSEEFLEYYYREKTRDNRILAAEEHGRIVSMLHRNPYRLKVGEQTGEADYLVAVATAKDRQRRGMMRALLTRGLKDMYREKMGFCFLMPADENIYRSFDFVTVFRQPCRNLTRRAEARLRKQRVFLGSQEVGRAARWMNGWLERRYQVFAKRTRDYVERLIKELESEDGWMELLVEEDGGCEEIKGIRCWWGLDEKEQRMLLTDEENMETAEKDTPVIMARIVHLETFLGSIALSSCRERQGESSLTIRLKLEDHLCPGNNGTFLWTVGRGGSQLCPWETGMKAEENLEISIGELTKWMFGRGEDVYGQAPWMAKIQVLSRVFLDEIV